MSETNSKATIVSMAVLASAAATLVHEALGHGVTAWLRGDQVTELTSNHLSAMRADRWVSAAGTIANAVVGLACLLAARAAGNRANTRYFLWLVAAFNLLPAAGYFMLSGIFYVGDWAAIIRDLPHQIPLRIAMTIFGAAAYYLCVRVLAFGIRPFIHGNRTYNIVARLPYLAAGLFGCAAGALDPLGLQLFFTATVAAAFGGSSGLLWADTLIPPPNLAPPLTVRPQPIVWALAIVLGTAYIVFLGRGIALPH